jgi:hypothetical protein
MLLDEGPNFVNLFAAEMVTPLQPNGVEPELRLRVVALNVDVRRLTTVPRIEEETVRTTAEYGRHVPMLRGAAAGSNSARAIPKVRAVEKPYQTAQPRVIVR